MSLDVDVIIDLIQSVGFPIFVAVWLLVRSDKQATEIKKAINCLNTHIETLIKIKEIK